MEAGPQKNYEERVQRFQREKNRLSHISVRLSWIRLIYFLAMIALVIFLIQVSEWLGMLFLLVAVGGFGFLIRYHERIENRMAFNDRLIDINRREIEALSHNFTWNEPGNSYKVDKHPYLSDLDIFGEFSLFQYICRAQSTLGKQKLAQWLSRPASDFQITRRQEAVQELEFAIDLRQFLQATAFTLNDDPKDLKKLERWLDSPNVLLGRNWVYVLRWVLPLVTLPSCLIIGYYLGLRYAWMPLIIPGLLIYKFGKRFTIINEETEKVAETLKTYSHFFARLQNHSFESDLLDAYHSKLKLPTGSASDTIHRLGYRIDQLNVRQNFFGIFFNLFGLWDFHWVLALEKLKKVMSIHLDEWLQIIAEVEALSSLANLIYSNEHYVYPSITTSETVVGVQVGHPLIPADERVYNDVHLLETNHIMLVTGSNMAGKSTYLRTTGINMVLANSGAPVCAEKFTFRPSPIVTSMRVSDAIEEGASSFYAELAKLKSVIDRVSVDPKMIFLLDEILKGTNSADRHRGSIALLKQLIKYAGVGIVATHDLALTKMEIEYPQTLENWYFDVVIESDKLKFDYRLKRGICSSFNATHLMRQMGIEIGD